MPAQLLGSTAIGPQPWPRAPIRTPHSLFAGRAGDAASTL
jgi:hypothetical protein